MSEISQPQLDATDRLLVWVVIIVRLLLVGSAIIGLLTLNWLEVFVSLMVLAMTYAVSFIERWHKINMPLEIEVYAVLLIYAALFLGEMRGYYDRFWWWDSIMHFTAAIVFGFIGFMIMYAIYHRNKLTASAVLIALFAFTFSMTIGAMWELFEFSLDELFGMTTQPSGRDTMIDLLLNAIGATITSVVGYFYIKTGSTGLFRRLVTKFMRDNPRIARVVSSRKKT
ncbi:MAG: hypothetical protein WD467_00290 [Candidatus Saccharimonadales bacterium]